MTQNQPLTAAQLRQELGHFTGDLERYRHPINRAILYTPGVKHLAERAGAYWLLDAIASWIGSTPFQAAIREDERAAWLHFWKLAVDETTRSAVLSAAADSGEAPFITQQVPFTDFPLPSIDVWAGFDGRHWTLYLPSEH